MKTDWYGLANHMLAAYARTINVAEKTVNRTKGEEYRSPRKGEKI